jgi:hypothetical protein
VHVGAPTTSLICGRCGQKSETSHVFLCQSALQADMATDIDCNRSGSTGAGHAGSVIG